MIDEAYFTDNWKVILFAANKTLPAGWEPDDWVNEIGARVWKSRKTYDPSRGKYSTWVIKIAIRLKLAKYRRKSYKCASIQGLLGNDRADYDFEDKNDAGVDRFAVVSDVRRALSKLTPARQELIGSLMKGERCIDYATDKNVSRQRVNQLMETALQQLHRILWSDYRSRNQ